MISKAQWVAAFIVGFGAGVILASLYYVYTFNLLPKGF